MFRKTLLTVAAILLCAGSVQAQSTEQLAQLTEWDKMIAGLRDRQAENTRLRQRLQDGTSVMLPLAFATREGKLVTVWDFMNDPTRHDQIFGTPGKPLPPTAISSLSAQYVPASKSYVRQQLTSYFVFQALSEYSLDTKEDREAFVKRVASTTKEAMAKAEAQTKEAIAGLAAQKTEIDTKLAKLIKARNVLQASIKSGKDVFPTIAEGGSFSGEWDTNWGLMKLSQTGNSVTGTYTHQQGRLEGTITNGVLRFRWVQPGNNGKGAGKMEISADGKSFKGAWTYEDDPEKSNNSWNGTRKSPVGGK